MNSKIQSFVVGSCANGEFIIENRNCIKVPKTNKNSELTIDVDGCSSDDGVIRKGLIPTIVRGLSMGMNSTLLICGSNWTPSFSSLDEVTIVENVINNIVTAPFGALTSCECAVEVSVVEVSNGSKLRDLLALSVGGGSQATEAQKQQTLSAWMQKVKRQQFKNMKDASEIGALLKDTLIRRMWLFDLQNTNKVEGQAIIYKPSSVGPVGHVFINVSVSQKFAATAAADTSQTTPALTITRSSEFTCVLLCGAETFAFRPATKQDSLIIVPRQQLASMETFKSDPDKEEGLKKILNARINQLNNGMVSLSALTRVAGLLRERSVAAAAATAATVGAVLTKMHVPFRETMLTRLLKEPLQGNSQTFLLVNLTGMDAECGLSNLRFAANLCQARTRIRPSSLQVALPASGSGSQSQQITLLRVDLFEYLNGTGSSSSSSVDTNINGVGAAAGLGIEADGGVIMTANNNTSNVRSRSSKGNEGIPIQDPDRHNEEDVSTNHSDPNNSETIDGTSSQSKGGGGGGFAASFVSAPFESQLARFQQAAEMMQRELLALRGNSAQSEFMLSRPAVGVTTADRVWRTIEPRSKSFIGGNDMEGESGMEVGSSSFWIRGQRINASSKSPDLFTDAEGDRDDDPCVIVVEDGDVVVAALGAEISVEVTSDSVVAGPSSPLPMKFVRLMCPGEEIGDGIQPTEQVHQQQANTSDQRPRSSSNGRNGNNGNRTPTRPNTSGKAVMTATGAATPPPALGSHSRAGSRRGGTSLAPIEQHQQQGDAVDGNDNANNANSASVVNRRPRTSTARDSSPSAANAAMGRASNGVNSPPPLHRAPSAINNNSTANANPHRPLLAHGVASGTGTGTAAGNGAASNSPLRPSHANTDGANANNNDSRNTRPLRSRTINTNRAATTATQESSRNRAATTVATSTTPAVSQPYLRANRPNQAATGNGNGTANHPSSSSPNSIIRNANVNAGMGGNAAFPAIPNRTENTSAAAGTSLAAVDTSKATSTGSTKSLFSKSAAANNAEDTTVDVKDNDVGANSVSSSSAEGTLSNNDGDVKQKLPELMPVRSVTTPTAATSSSAGTSGKKVTTTLRSDSEERPPSNLFGTRSSGSSRFSFKDNCVVSDSSGKATFDVVDECFRVAAEEEESEVEAELEGGFRDSEDSTRPRSDSNTSTSPVTAPAPEKSDKPSTTSIPRTSSTKSSTVAAVAPTPTAVRRLLRPMSGMSTDSAGSPTLHDDGESDGMSGVNGDLIRNVQLNRVEAAEQNLRRGADVNVVNSFGRTPMMIATRNGSVPMLSMLQGWGASLSCRGPRGETLLHLAVGADQLPAIRWLHEAGGASATMACAVDLLGQSVAHVAARRLELGVMKYLHEMMRVDFSAEDFDGRTPLMCVPRVSVIQSVQQRDACRSFILRVCGLEM